jgi:hypothetical protein
VPEPESPEPFAITKAVRQALANEATDRDERDAASAPLRTVMPRPAKKAGVDVLSMLDDLERKLR